MTEQTNRTPQGGRDPGQRWQPQLRVPRLAPATCPAAPSCSCLWPLLYLVGNPRPGWKCLQIYMVLFTGPLPISDTLKFPYMTHCCSDNKQVISWVGGQLPDGFDSLFLNQLKRLIKMQGPQSKAQETPKAGGQMGLLCTQALGHYVICSPL